MAKEVSACVDAVARERRFLGNVVGFTADDTRSFVASLAEKGGVQMVALDERVVIGWCDVTTVPFEGMRHVGRLGMGWDAIADFISATSEYPLRAAGL